LPGDWHTVPEPLAPQDCPVDAAEAIGAAAIAAAAAPAANTGTTRVSLNFTVALLDWLSLYTISLTR
jgi:hypothetical protein